MKAGQAFDKVAGISSAAVQAKTGKTWAEWVAILDAAGAKAMTHQEVVAHLHDQHGVGPWWQQMVTNGYEQARKGRARHQMPDGFQVSASKTLAVPAEALFTEWHDARARARWLGRGGLAVTTARPSKSIRLKWPDEDSRVSVNFYVKGAGKCQVTVEHSQLKSARAAAQMKKFWAEALDRLQTRVEK
jgi:uncharacterized protein YndB with AHSA1/START domain